jgi:hypothetical protein
LVRRVPDSAKEASGSDADLTIHPNAILKPTCEPLNSLLSATLKAESPPRGTGFPLRDTQFTPLGSRGFVHFDAFGTTFMGRDREFCSETDVIINVLETGHHNQWYSWPSIG